MSIESTLFSTLSADATVRGYVSSGSPLVHRIYPNLAPDGVADPYITYQVITYVAHNRLGEAPGTHRKLVQVNCWASSYDTAKSLAEACRAALDQLGHQMGGTDDYFAESQTHRVAIDFAFIQAY